MPLKSLESMAASIAPGSLPANWNTFDLARFSPSKSLWDYQQKAVQYALGILFTYYEQFADYEPGEDDQANQRRRAKLVDWYQDAMLLTAKERASLNLNLGKAKTALRALIGDYFPLDDEAPAIDFASICNRMGFWMATGSGKTVVLVKLLETLHLLMRRQEIPVCEVLMLTHREDLIAQFQKTVAEYNHAPDAAVHIELRELREFPEAMRESPGGLLGRDSTLRVFYYRSDNLSDEHKDRIVDFRNYDHHGRWYVLLDEAHKGVAEDAKRKHIVNILSRNGFLFNFSATFTDVIDEVTTAYNFNLSEFITHGYGKHIAVLKQELAAFRQRGGTGDYTDEEKRKVVVKSMILLALTARKIRDVRKAADDATLYHQPMLLTLVNSVNTEDADLKLYFEQVLAIGRGKVSSRLWKDARAELWEELQGEPEFLYEDGRKVSVAKHDLEAITARDIWRDVYNLDSDSGGEIEVLVRPGNRQEIAFKMKASAKPFALIKIGDITGWLREKLTGFEFIETLETESFFSGLNDADSSINILMGSRTFYEGWDSNRPNVINFVNIGTGDDARKFIMQSVGRGVRVQSWRGTRRRFEELHELFDDRGWFRNVRAKATPAETLYVLGTNREALQTVLQELKKEKPLYQDFLKLSLHPEAGKRLLLVPEYRDKLTPLMEEKAQSKFELAEDDFRLLASYDASVSDDRLLLLAHGGAPRNVHYFRESIEKDEAYFATSSRPAFRNVDVMVGRVMEYFGLRAREVEGIRALTEQDIVHFRQMSVDHAHAAEIQKRVEKVLYSVGPDGKKKERAIHAQVEQLDLDFAGKFEEARRLLDEAGISRKETYADDVTIEYMANHYYLPVIHSKGAKLAYLRHIIDTESEIRFLDKLTAYLKKGDNKLQALDWWMFSKLDPYLDAPYIPYYEPNQNRIARFIPDFIFWGKKGKRYTILFIDPHGTEQVEWMRKFDGYKALFEDGKGRIRTFAHEGIEVVVKAALFVRDINALPNEAYKAYCADTMGALFDVAFPSS